MFKQIQTHDVSTKTTSLLSKKRTIYAWPITVHDQQTNG